MDSKGKYDKRNKLNDLTGKEWLKLTGSFWASEKCVDDKPAMQHPAPFLNIVIRWRCYYVIYLFYWI
jgi:hypothetical protein